MFVSSGLHPCDWILVPSQPGLGPGDARKGLLVVDRKTKVTWWPRQLEPRAQIPGLTGLLSRSICGANQWRTSNMVSCIIHLPALVHSQFLSEARNTESIADAVLRGHLGAFPILPTYLCLSDVTEYMSASSLSDSRTQRAPQASMHWHVLFPVLRCCSLSCA